MRRLKADVSHRIRSRGPSIFAAGWFRIVLGVGVVAIAALVVGPSVAGWLGADLPRSVFLLSPWGASESVKSVAHEPASVDATPRPATDPVPTASTTESASPPGFAGSVADPALVGSPAFPGAPRAAAAAASEQEPIKPSGAKAPPPALTTPAPVYWIQIGAFLDHRNADRLIDRLRTEGLSAATTVFEQSRTLYRVIIDGPDGGVVPDQVLERVRGLGFPVETTDEGPAATAAVPLRTAVEASHRLRDQGVQVRLKQEIGSATYRIVRVGSYPTSKEAEQVLAKLSARGIEGAFVVRDR